MILNLKNRNDSTQHKIQYIINMNDNTNTVRLGSWKKIYLIYVIDHIIYKYSIEFRIPTRKHAATGLFVWDCGAFQTYLSVMSYMRERRMRGNTLVFYWVHIWWFSNQRDPQEGACCARSRRMCVRKYLVVDWTAVEIF